MHGWYEDIAGDLRYYVGTLGVLHNRIGQLAPLVRIASNDTENNASQLQRLLDELNEAHLEFLMRPGEVPETAKEAEALVGEVWAAVAALSKAFDEEGTINARVVQQYVELTQTHDKAYRAMPTEADAFAVGKAAGSAFRTKARKTSLSSGNDNQEH